MDALKESSCPVRAALIAAWHNAAEIYSKAVAELSRQIGIISKDEYQRLKRLAENALQTSIDAQATLEAHIEGHGCDGNGEAAA
jgi:hypothetical protein